MIAKKSFAPTQLTDQSILNNLLFMSLFFLCPIETGIYKHSKDFDKQGVVYALTTNSRKTSNIVVTRSSDGEGKAEDVLKNQVKSGTVSGTKDKENSWWSVDLTEKYALYLTHYTLRHGHNRGISVLLNWRLEGSLDGRKWTKLKIHEKEYGLLEHCTCTWAIDGKSNAFRYFRIFQTGKNSSRKFGIFLSGIEMYGLLIEKKQLMLHIFRNIRTMEILGVA